MPTKPRKRPPRSPPKRRPYVVAVRGPGLRIDVALDKPGNLGGVLTRLAEAITRNLDPLPPASPFADHYETLGVRPDATTEEIQDAYMRKIVKEMTNTSLEKAIRTATEEVERRASSTS